MALSMTGIDKAFGANRVLKGVDFSVGDGEIHALIGENGAGKTTLMNILGGVLQPDAAKCAQRCARAVQCAARLSGCGNCVHSPGTEPRE